MNSAQALIKPFFFISQANGMALWMASCSVNHFNQTKTPQHLWIGIKYIHAPQRMKLLGTLDTFTTSISISHQHKVFNKMSQQLLDDFPWNPEPWCPDDVSQWHWWSWLFSSTIIRPKFQFWLILWFLYLTACLFYYTTEPLAWWTLVILEYWYFCKPFRIWDQRLWHWEQWSVSTDNANIDFLENKTSSASATTHWKIKDKKEQGSDANMNTSSEVINAEKGDEENKAYKE